MRLDHGAVIDPCRLTTIRRNLANRGVAAMRDLTSAGTAMVGNAPRLGCAVRGPPGDDRAQNQDEPGRDPRPASVLELMFGAVPVCLSWNRMTTEAADGQALRLWCDAVGGCWRLECR
jgi:hypothetical protein